MTSQRSVTFTNRRVHTNTLCHFTSTVCIKAYAQRKNNSLNYNLNKMLGKTPFTDDMFSVFLYVIFASFRYIPCILMLMQEEHLPNALFVYESVQI